MITKTWQERTLTAEDSRTGSDITGRLIPESAISKVQQCCRDQGFEISPEDALRDLLRAVSLVKLVLNAVNPLSPIPATQAVPAGAPDSGTEPTYYSGASHA